MKIARETIAASILLGFAACLFWLRQGAAFSAPQMVGNSGVPAYHSQLPAGQLPVTLSPRQFTDPVAQNAYAIAGRMKKTLYQQPCYCYCDRSQGHGSLLDCFASKHGSGCGTCIQEALYTYEEFRKGRTAAQIREGIERGEWQAVDLSKYQKPI